MDSKNTPVRVKSGGTQISRRTVARGVAWSAPIAVVGVAAPAFAASCAPQISFDNGRSCKCPGQSDPGEEFAYYVGFCVTNTCNDGGQGAGGTFTVISVAKSNGGLFVNTPNNCFPAVLGTGSTASGSCTTDVYRMISDNSGNFVKVTFDFTINGITTRYTQQLPSPPKCTNDNLADGRCVNCTK
jgi:hypothetical protein